MGAAEEVGGKLGDGDDNNDGNDDNNKEETNAAQSFVACFLEKEMKEPWHLPLLVSLEDDMMDPDPEGGVGGEGGEWGVRREQRSRQRRDEHRAVHRLLFLGEGDEGALASSSPADDVGHGSILVCANN